MALQKNFLEFYELDISEYTIQREINGKKYTYLPWEACIKLLYRHGAESVSWTNVCNSDGYPAFFVNGINPFVRILLAVDDVKFPFDFPVIDGEFVKPVPNQLDIHVATQRAFVKAVAIRFGLGLKLWEKDASEPPVEKNDTSSVDLLKPIDQAVKVTGSSLRLVERLGITEKRLGEIIESDDAAAKEWLLFELDKINSPF